MLDLEEKFSVDTLSSISYSASDVRKGNRTESVANLENYESNMYSIQVKLTLVRIHHYKSNCPFVFRREYYSRGWIITITFNDLFYGPDLILAGHHHEKLIISEQT